MSEITLARKVKTTWDAVTWATVQRVLRTAGIPVELRGTALMLLKAGNHVGIIDIAGDQAVSLYNDGCEEYSISWHRPESVYGNTAQFWFDIYLDREAAYGSKFCTILG